MTYNDSKKHESSFTSVKIQENNSIMLSSLAGTTLGVWISHGEGKFKLPNLASSSNMDLFQKISKDYLALVNEFKTQEQIVTDKAPLNFRWIGFIKIFFPNAKIVHCKREAKDNCLSLYKNIFDENQNWTYNTTDILNYYKNYKNLMDFWKMKLPNFIYNCSQSC